MGARKSIRAEKLKAEKKQKAIAVLNDCPTSPLKMRIVADLIRESKSTRRWVSFATARNRLRSDWRSCCAPPSPTGRRKTRASVWRTTA